MSVVEHDTFRIEIPDDTKSNTSFYIVRLMCVGFFYFQEIYLCYLLYDVKIKVTRGRTANKSNRYEIISKLVELRNIKQN